MPESLLFVIIIPNYKTMKLLANNTQFLSGELRKCTFEESTIVIIPAPLEKTVSYGHGTSKGPQAILEASYYLELYDEELNCEPFHDGIFTTEMLSNDLTHQKFLNTLEYQLSYVIESGKKPVIIGGEHSLTIAPLQAIRRSQNLEFTVLHFDAHADLRDHYENSRLSHACVMRRAHEIGVDLVSVGIRAISQEEVDFISSANCSIFFAKEIISNVNLIEHALSLVKKNVYITLDIDVFDPSVIHQTGTPEPGGLTWYQLLTILKRISDLNINVLGFDLVEFAPLEENHSQRYTCAKLIYKMMSYYWR